MRDQSDVSYLDGRVSGSDDIRRSRQRIGHVSRAALLGMYSEQVVAEFALLYLVPNPSPKSQLFLTQKKLER